MSLKVEVWGRYACFTRPELKVERMSYDVMTPSAARGILEAVYWHPGMRWIIDGIYVLNPVVFTGIRRNEVKSKISARNVKQVMDGKNEELSVFTAEDIQQRASTVLQDVRYVIDAHFLPYYWIYFSPTYFYASIIIPVVSLIFGLNFSQAIVCLAFVVLDIIICILLCLENKQANKYLETINNQEQ